MPSNETPANETPVEKTPTQTELEDSLQSVRSTGENATGEGTQDHDEQPDAGKANPVQVDPD